LKTTKPQSVAVGDKLIKALTKDQIAQLLSAVFNLLDKQKLNEISSTLNEDISTTLSRLLTAKKREGRPPLPKRIVSDQKLIAEWEKLWSEWDDIAEEAGEEEGKYIYQEHHWEHPYFTGDDLSEDLEQIAERMLPRLEKIHALDAADDEIFERGLQDIETAIQTLPEWLGADSDGFGLGTFATQCVLKWEWLVASSQKEPVIAFVERLVAIENSLTLVNLDGEDVVKFFMALSEKVKRQIYDYITANRGYPQWEERLSSSYSKWHRLYHAFSESFSPETYLENCREMLHENWYYGLPLVENFLKKKEYSEADKVIAETFSSFLRYRTNERWKPEEELLIEFMRYGYQAPEKGITQLLKHWKVIAEKLGQAEKAAALKLQIVTYKKPFDWDAVIAVCQEIRTFPVANVAKKLFNQWQLFIFNHSVQGSDEISKEPKESWIHWLIETGLDEAKNKRWFAQKMETWLEHLYQNPAEFKKQHHQVYTLTQDLAQKSPLQKQYPKLFDHVLNHGYVDRECAPTRRAWLEKMQGEKLIPLLMKCWKQNIAMLVPDPARSSKSSYEDHAAWLAVVNELNPAACKAIIDHWKVDHKKRRNLWLALKAKKLPMEGSKPEKLFV
jgi:hypothetical protein